MDNNNGNYSQMNFLFKKTNGRELKNYLINKKNSMGM